MKRHWVDAVGRRTEPDTSERSTDYVVGIDTGGTFTDGVLLDYRSRRVIAAGKTLTTRENLTHGIIEILQRLQIPDPSKVKLVGISSTLATNSIAESKARQVGLVLIGYDTDLIASYSLASKFPTQYLGYFKGGHTAQGTEKEPLDLVGICAWVQKQTQHVDALAVSSFFSPLNPEHEERVLAAIREISSLPVVLGHQLSTKLDSIRRATTACLNASLVAVMQEFIEAVRDSLRNQGLNAPLMIVKGDGSLMPYAEAAQKPVETVLSGPAASAIGGRFLSAHGSALVIDVGGTTTDLALIENNQMTISEDGARVGDIETAVKAARIRTAGIGCDSRIAFGTNGSVQVGPDRVVPLSRLASRFPQVAREILNLKQKRRANCRLADIEYWLLYKPAQAIGLAPKDPRRRLLDLLELGPCSLTRILKTMQVHHPIQLNVQSLIRQGYIEHATLTPTDLLHVNGQMDAWDAAAARQALEHACTLLEKDRTRFVAETLDGIVATMVKEAIVFLARQKQNDHLPENPDGAWGPCLSTNPWPETTPF